MEVATFAPHAPYTPAPRNANDFPGLKEPRDPSFNTNNVNPPAWLGHRSRWGRSSSPRLDRDFRKRAQAVESVDKLLADTRRRCRPSTCSTNTYIVFSSDNGYHLGQHRLTRGKQTAFDTDIRVPLIVAGPGVPEGRTVSQVAQNIDLYPTFVQLAGAPRRAGRRPQPGAAAAPGRAPGARGAPSRSSSTTAANNDPNDPDFERRRAATRPPTRRSGSRAGTCPDFSGPVEAVYVEYKDAAHEIEYYDIRKDPYERDNIANRLTSRQRSELHRILLGLERCHGASACWRAGMPS